VKSSRPLLSSLRLSGRSAGLREPEQEAIDHLDPGLNPYGVKIDIASRTDDRLFLDGLEPLKMLLVNLQLDDEDEYQKTQQAQFVLVGDHLALKRPDESVVRIIHLNAESFGDERGSSRGARAKREAQRRASRARRRAACTTIDIESMISNCARDASILLRPVSGSQLRLIKAKHGK